MILGSVQTIVARYKGREYMVHVSIYGYSMATAHKLVGGTLGCGHKCCWGGSLVRIRYGN